MKDDDQPPAPPYQPPHHPHRLLVGHVFTYTWPTGESAMVIVTTPPDEHDEVGIAILSENRRVPITGLIRLA